MSERWKKIEDAIDESRETAIYAAKNGSGQGQAFCFARILRSWEWRRPRTGESFLPTPDEAAGYLEAVYVAAYPKQKPEAFWNLFEGVKGDGREEFLWAWGQVRVPEGKTLWNMVDASARALPLQPGLRRSDGYCQFLSHAGHLQRLRPRQNIQLPVHHLARKFGVTAMTLSRYRRWAIEDGFLRQEQAHDHLHGQATEFRFLVEKFDWTTGKQTDVTQCVTSDTARSAAKRPADVTQRNTEILCVTPSVLQREIQRNTESERFFSKTLSPTRDKNHDQRQQQPQKQKPSTKRKPKVKSKSDHIRKAAGKESAFEKARLGSTRIQ